MPTIASRTLNVSARLVNIPVIGPEAFTAVSDCALPNENVNANAIMREVFFIMQLFRWVQIYIKELLMPIMG